MTITLTDTKLPTRQGGHAGSGGRVEWWNTAGVLSETQPASVPSVAYNGPQGTTFSGLTNWLHASGFGLTVPPAGTVNAVHGIFRARKIGPAAVFIRKAALRVVRPDTPYYTFPVDTEKALDIQVTNEWANYTVIWDGAQVHPRAIDVINQLVASEQFGFALAADSPGGGKIEVDWMKMALAIDDHVVVVPPVDPTLLDELMSVRDALTEARAVIEASAVPALQSAETAIGRADALISRIADESGADSPPV